MSPDRQSRAGCLVMVADGGATHTRACVADLEGQIYGRGEAGPGNAFAVGFRRAQENLGLALQGALHDSGVAVSDIRAVVAGLASVGVWGEGSAPFLQQFHRLLPKARVQILGDMLIAHEGALAGKPGVVIVSGTGSVVFGRDEEGNAVKVGGWGAWFGDEGSAQWIGREGLRRAAHAVDGTGQPTALVRALERHFRVQGFRHIVPLIYHDFSPAGLGELAPVVSACARCGDRVAQQLVREAAEWLAHQASTAMKGLHLKRPEISYEGSLLRGEACLQRAVEQSLRRLAPGAKFVAPCLPPTGGAWLMAAKLVGIHPTRAAIQTFRRQCHD
jgi:N-acetylglucosamine kinase-like BadF-type ATPase